jgi:hypothetical protein
MRIVLALGVGHDGGLTLRPFPRIDQRFQPASSRTTSPSRSSASGPPAAASGDTWIAAGTLPEAPLMRPSVTSATRKPLPCRTASGGVSLCSSGMPLARGPCQRTTQTRSHSSSPAWKAASIASWLSKMRAGASITCRSCGTADTLITLRPRLPVSSRRPPVRLNGCPAGRTMLSSPDAPMSLQRSPGVPSACAQSGMRVYSRRPPSRTVSTSSCIRPASSSSRIT